MQVGLEKGKANLCSKLQEEVTDQSSKNTKMLDH